MPVLDLSLKLNGLTVTIAPTAPCLTSPVAVMVRLHAGLDLRGGSLTVHMVGRVESAAQFPELHGDMLRNASICAVESGAIFGMVST